jgi:hypothetical protein
MSLAVYTAQYRYDGPDRFDITRSKAPPEQKIYAPPWRLLNWGKDMRAMAERRLVDARASGQESALRAAEGFEQWAWMGYRARYEEAMRVSFKNHRPAWNELLARDRVVLVCFCADRNRCHRGVLAELLAKCGATDLGEIEITTQGEDHNVAFSFRA